MYFHGDKLVRKFLKKGYESSNSIQTLDVLQEPTYLTFGLYFVFNTFNNLNTLTNGLLLSTDTGNSESSVRYLQRIGEPTRAKYLTEFQSLLQYVSEENPWYFKSISGVSDLWKIESGQNFRGKEKVLTIECEESLDFRMTALADLYRKSALDPVYMRNILPRSKRRFTCELIVFEYRKFVQYKNSSAPTMSTPPIPSSANNTSTVYESLKWMQNYTSCVHFLLENCEFDFNDFPLGDNLLASGGTDPAAQRFKIKVGTIREVNRYPILGYLLSDNGTNSIINNSIGGQKLNSSQPIDDYEPLVKPTEDNWENFDNLANEILTRRIKRSSTDDSSLFGPLAGDTSLLDHLLSGDFFSKKFVDDNITRLEKLASDKYTQALEKGKNIFETVVSGGGGIVDKVLSGDILGLVYDTKTGKVNTSLINEDNIRRLLLLTGLDGSDTFKKIDNIYQIGSDATSVLLGDTEKGVTNIIKNEFERSALRRKLEDQLFTEAYQTLSKAGQKVFLGKIYGPATDDEVHQELLSLGREQRLDKLKSLTTGILTEVGNDPNGKKRLRQLNDAGDGDAVKDDTRPALGSIYSASDSKPKKNLDGATIDTNPPNKPAKKNLGNVNDGSPPVKSGHI